MHARVLRRLLIALVACTLGALAWNQFGMNVTMSIDARSPFPLTAVDDPGDTVSTATRNVRELGLDCQIAGGDDHPFCELRVQFRQPPNGFDLSRFDSMRLWISASGPEPQQRVRVYLRHFDPAYSRAESLDSQKVNQIVFDPAAYPAGYEVPLSRFDVAGWWADDHPMALELDGADLRNVTMLAFATGPRVEQGLHRIRVQRVEFRGKLVPPAELRLGIIILWTVSVLVYLLADGVMTRNQLRLSSASQHSLQRLNESLKLETRSLAELARQDPMTGALNRKGLADELLRLVRMSGDAIFPFSLVFIDIDHFKRVNDTRGHEVGDQVIRGLAALVRSAVQRDDLFARWGGEEFLLVFRNTGGMEARVIAERLRERIADGKWPADLRITCSFGVAEWHQGEDLNDGVKRADEAMYRAKQNGRDRVEVELDFDPDDPGAADQSQPTLRNRR